MAARSRAGTRRFRAGDGRGAHRLWMLSQWLLYLSGSARSVGSAASFWSELPMLLSGPATGFPSRRSGSEAKQAPCRSRAGSAHEFVWSRSDRARTSISAFKAAGSATLPCWRSAPFPAGDGPSSRRSKATAKRNGREGPMGPAVGRDGMEIFARALLGMAPARRRMDRAFRCEPQETGPGRRRLDDPGCPAIPRGAVERPSARSAQSERDAHLAR